MNLVPLRDDFLFPLEQTFNKFFEDFFNNKSNANVAKANSTYPKYNSYLEGDCYKVVVAVPGVALEDLEVDKGTSGTIIIRGKSARKYQSAPDSQFYVREIRLSSFERMISLPDGVDGEPADAILENGLLTLTWKLTPKETNNRIRISVKEGK